MAYIENILTVIALLLAIIVGALIAILVLMPTRKD